MRQVRKWGHGPFTVAVLHGGPGAPGEMAPVARELSAAKSVLEPFQTGTTLDMQVNELKDVLAHDGVPPVTVVGFSYGAVLGFLCSARYPELVKKLILVGCPPFEEQYAASITRTRLGRLDKDQRKEVQAIQSALEDPDYPKKHEAFARFGMLMERADAYHPLPVEDTLLHSQYDIFQPVWEEVSALRHSGDLLQAAKKIRCPVVAIHGDYDPHPANGVSEPLSGVLGDFRFILLQKCGHRPWTERDARDEFFSILMQEI
jgi:pimeloyl-ACP methyl ester carboxylesterase